ncbi:MAG: glutamine synthetase family protein [Gammaproteobacteria bacterium]|nr:glutamine synthetase family protein [Gammaproteobacteria bacterium]
MHDELKKFLSRHPDTVFIDALFVDLCGVVRCKRYPRREAEKIFSGGVHMCHSVYLLDARGENANPQGRGMDDGDPDGMCAPVAGTLSPSPWSDAPCGQVLMTVLEDDGAPCAVEPRNIAARAARFLAELELRPVAAFELEFYLLQKNLDAAGCPQLPLSPRDGRPEQATQVYAMEELDRHREFFRRVEDACELQGVPASVATKEFAPGQFEINLRHVADPLAAADHCALLRHTVKQCAGRCGMLATFLSKPFSHLSGSGMHLHLSLLDKNGANVFDDGSELGGETLRHAVGGLMQTMFDAFAIYAPSVNAMRRFRPNRFVPVRKSWGANNRSVAFRVPAGQPPARRIENRVAGADANPWLVLAVTLAAVHHGITTRADPGAPARGNAGEHPGPELPANFPAALEKLRSAKTLAKYLGQEYLDLYCETKRTEFERLSEAVSPVEYEWYL